MNDFLVPKPESLGHPSEDGKNNYSDSDSQRFEDGQGPNNGRRQTTMQRGRSVQSSNEGRNSNTMRPIGLSGNEEQKEENNQLLR